MTKKYKTTNELIEILETKNVCINDKEKAIYNINKYSYYSIVNS